MKILAISDLHGHIPILTQEADVLVIAGDLTPWGTIGEYVMLNSWLGTLPYEHKIIIAGNHDEFLDKAPMRKKKALFSNATYLENSGVVINGWRFWGSPYTPRFGHWHFMLEDSALYSIWDRIHKDTDILITHGPPRGILDTEEYKLNYGSTSLRMKVSELNPKVHIFGHIHNAHGYRQEADTHYYNCSLLNRQYKPEYEPHLIDLNAL